MEPEAAYLETLQVLAQITMGNKCISKVDIVLALGIKRRHRSFQSKRGCGNVQPCCFHPCIGEERLENSSIQIPKGSGRARFQDMAGKAAAEFFALIARMGTIELNVLQVYKKLCDPGMTDVQSFGAKSAVKQCTWEVPLYSHLGKCDGKDWFHDCIALVLG